MKVTEIDIFEAAIQKTHLWLTEVMEELKWTDRHKAYLALRATLHALRDRLTTEEAVHLGAQLPMLIRGFYYEGWKPDSKPLRKMEKEIFLNKINSYFRNDPTVNAEEVTRAIFRILSKKISGGEIEDIKRMLPEELREFWP
jgi:uncharacterized protein (DUF2267 family)